MNFPTDRILKSHRLFPASRSGWLIPIGFMISITVIFSMGMAVDLVASTRPAALQIVYRPILFPGMFTFAPFALASVCTLRGLSLTVAASVGIVPGVAFLLLGWGSTLTGVGSSGDAPAWVLSIAFSQVGLGCALVGIGTAVTAQKISERIRHNHSD